MLQARQTLLNELYAEAKTRLSDLSKQQSTYADLLKGLVLQGLFGLMESNVTIQCRAEDVDLVKKAIEHAKDKYQQAQFKKNPKEVKVTIDEANPLPSQSAGGIALSAVEGRIKIANTLESRLELLQDQMLPEIRVLLYGPSPSRKFFN